MSNKKVNPNAEFRKGGSFTKDPKTGKLTCTREPTKMKKSQPPIVQKLTNAEK